MKYNIVSFWNDNATLEEKEKLILLTAKGQGDVRENIERWAVDPNCNQAALCADLLARRSVEWETRAAKRREQLESNPFDPRTEVSAGAQHIANRIVKHLWIIFVLLPVVLGILYAILRAL